MALGTLLARLAEEHGEPKELRFRTPLERILFENVAYLVDDERRAEAFAALRRRIGLSAAAILAADETTLREVAALGGMLAEERVAKLREIALLALELGDDELRGTLAMAPDAARKVFARFPGIGRPGADKLLLFCGIAPVLAFESNGLRVLLRLGYGKEGASYAASYRSACAAVESELPATGEARRRAHVLLRRHGQTLCRRTTPDCSRCCLAADCPARVRP
ncbi:MAG: hypothetical protein IT457_05955 [Planctomycetes bacterium]|nr:hypothetical protein [Planctomycetota bacterium]